jgi:hypothetical protein
MKERTMMELDELKEKWAEHDRKLEQSVRLNRELLKAMNLRRVESALRRLRIYAGLEAVMWLVVIVALGNFVYEHIGMPRFALPAIALDAMAIGMLSALIRQMVGTSRIDYGQPIAEIQRRVEAVRMLRIRTTQWALLGGTLFWVPFVIVVFKAFFGVDVYREVDEAWLIVNVLCGLAVFPAAIWVSKKYGDRMDRSPFIHRMMKDLAGNNLTAAQGFLATLREFERE